MEQPHLLLGVIKEEGEVEAEEEVAVVDALVEEDLDAVADPAAVEIPKAVVAEGRRLMALTLPTHIGVLHHRNLIN